MNDSASVAWRALIQAALHRNRSDPGARYIQLATVDPQGHPRNRTVVFRGFLGNSERILMAVDSRSEKIHHIAHRPQAQICWYFCKTREQFRIAGTLETIAADHPDPQALKQRLQLWQQI
ncbi:MAG: pyridoxamine 5'-phosphate oxidase family protein, partial [Thermostichus sp. DG_1_5_bins_95]